MKKVNTYVHVYRLQLSKSEIANQFINMGMQNEYELTSIGMLGPFRECF